MLFIFDPFATSAKRAGRWKVPKEQATKLERLRTQFGGRPLQDFGHHRGCWAVVCVKLFSVVHHLGLCFAVDNMCLSVGCEFCCRSKL